MVANSATNLSTFINHITTSVPTFITSSSGMSALLNCTETSTSTPIITGAGLISYAAIIYSSTGKGGASTLNAGQGALPLDFAPLKWRSGTLRPTAIDGLLEYDGTNLWQTVGTTRIKLTTVGGTDFQTPIIVSVPSTATSAGVAGSVAIDATHIYLCTATNTWVRGLLTMAAW